MQDLGHQHWQVHGDIPRPHRRGTPTRQPFPKYPSIIIVLPLKVLDIAFNSTGTRLVTASADSTARVYNVHTG